MDQLHRGPDPFVDFLFVAPAEDETPEDAWFLGVKKNGGRYGHCGVVLGFEPS